MIGRTLAHYEITSLLGKGGMGEVYRARDTKLDRQVAIKVLPTEMSGDPERLARFEREARTLATLQHTNIASVYGFETAEAVRFLVMELVEGEDLSEILQRGAIPQEEAVDIAMQLAAGLAAAHTVGIIHRDLKPANIKISEDGRVKILDFGLARAYTGQDGSGSDPEHSPTITAAMTHAGVILGTAAYMSPEQARGKRVDHRADIWAFGVVFFEMLTGIRLFEGETVSDTLAGVLRADVPWGQLPKSTAPTVRRLLERCLDRNPSRRLQAIAEAHIALEEFKAGHVDELSRAPAGSRSGFQRERLAWIATVAALAVVAAWALLRHAAPEKRVIQSTLLPPEGWDFAPASPFAVSPDGSQIAFVALARPENETVTAGATAIWIRDLAAPESRQLTSAEKGAYPFWSPDGRWLGFFANGKLNKIEARGGPVVPICDASDGRGGTWNDAGTIIFQRAWSEGLMRVPAGGGTPEPVTTLNAAHFDVAHRWPQFLPDGKHFLFYVVSTMNPLASEHTGIYVGSVGSGEPTFLLKSESRALYTRGYLLYRSGSTLMAHRFDAAKLRLTGDPTPLASDIPGGLVSWGGAQFGCTEDVVAYMRGTEAARTLLVWRDRAGNALSTVGDPAGYWEPRLSHDGSRVAVAIGHDVADIWVIDLNSDMRTRLTFDPADDRTPVWSPDDRQLAFSSGRKAEGEIYVRPSSGQGDDTLIYTANAQIALTDWSSDGRFIFFNVATPGTGGFNIWSLDVHTSSATVLLTGNWFEGARLSPDGKWLAFASYESGNGEIYIESFPAHSGRWMVSSDAMPGEASFPAWRNDGRELYYFRGRTVVSVPVSGDAGFSVGKPQGLFTVSVTNASEGAFAVSADGQSILTNELPPADQSKIGARLIQNWMVALER